MPVSLPTVLILFSFLIDLKEMPIDEYIKQLLPESKHRLVTQLGHCKMLCFGHVAAWFLSKRFYILGTCIIFHEIMFSGRFYFIQGALLFLYSAFLFLHSAFLMLHSAFLKFSVWVSTCIFSPIVSQLRYFTFLPNCHAAIISISWCEALISWLV